MNLNNSKKNKSFIIPAIIYKQDRMEIKVINSKPFNPSIKLNAFTIAVIAIAKKITNAHELFLKKSENMGKSISGSENVLFIKTSSDDKKIKNKRVVGSILL